MKILCNEKDYSKLRSCFKKGLCPEESNNNTDYCYKECVYNKYNIEIEYRNNSKLITLIGINEDHVCYRDTLFNYLKCGECETGLSCDSCGCRFYYENIEFKVK